ncbi:MAG: 4a-hydroxytetrahydrobiopterin dehydratase [Thermoleophilia bacterium]
MAVLSDDEIDSALAGLPGWRREGSAITKDYRFDGGFASSIDFVDRLAAAAEAANHHPDLAIRWDTVTVELSTHSQGGVTERDLALAAEADGLAAGGA